MQSQDEQSTEHVDSQDVARPTTGVKIDLTSCATLSFVEASRVLGIHRSTAWDLHRRGGFPVPVLRIGNRLRVTKAHLERFLLTGESHVAGRAN
jgi:Helix-turn-helix domain